MKWLTQIVSLFHKKLLFKDKRNLWKFLIFEIIRNDIDIQIFDPAKDIFFRGENGHYEPAKVINDVNAKIWIGREEFCDYSDFASKMNCKITKEFINNSFKYFLQKDCLKTEISIILHEVGHYFSDIGNHIKSEHRDLINGGWKKHKIDSLTPQEKEAIFEEEVRAWDYGEKVLQHLTRVHFNEFYEERKRGLSSYEEGLYGAGSCWESDIIKKNIKVEEELVQAFFKNNLV